MRGWREQRERERDVKPLQKNVSFLWSCLVNRSRETAVGPLLPVSLLLPPLPLSVVFFLPGPSLHIPFPVQFIHHSSAHPPASFTADSHQIKLHQCGSMQAMPVHVSPHPIPPLMAGALHLSFVVSVFCTAFVSTQCYSNKMCTAQLVLQQIDNRNNTYRGCNSFNLVWRKCQTTNKQTNTSLKCS